MSARRRCLSVLPSCWSHTCWEPGCVLGHRGALRGRAAAASPDRGSPLQGLTVQVTRSQTCDRPSPRAATRHSGAVSHPARCPRVSRVEGRESVGWVGSPQALARSRHGAAEVPSRAPDGSILVTLQPLWAKTGEPPGGSSCSAHVQVGVGLCRPAPSGDCKGWVLFSVQRFRTQTSAASGSQPILAGHWPVFFLVPSPWHVLLASFPT